MTNCIHITILDPAPSTRIRIDHPTIDDLHITIATPESAEITLDADTLEILEHRIDID